MRVQLQNGNCKDVLAGLPNCSVDSVVTDPPYELGFMGKAWDSVGVAYDVRLWAEVLRVLKPGGHLLAFGGTRTYHRMAVAIEDVGFEIRDSLHWVYGSGFPKSLDVSKAIDKAGGDGSPFLGLGTALKPAHEPVVVARKPLVGTVAANVLEHGTGALNIDGCRVGRAAGDTSHAGHRTATFGTQETTSGGDGSGGWTQNAGRWPANLVLTHAAECGEACAEGCPVAELDGQSGGASRFFTVTEWDPIADVAPFRYVAKPSKRERNAGLDGLPDRRQDEDDYERAGTTNPRNRSQLARKNHHPTVKPVSLMKWLVRLVTPPGGTVLDPFAGSGTTLVAAVLEGFDAIGIEITDDYLPIIEGRVAWAKNAVAKTDLRLFGDSA